MLCFASQNNLFESLINYLDHNHPHITDIVEIGEEMKEITNYSISNCLLLLQFICDFS